MEFDFARFHQPPLIDFLAGRLAPARALRIFMTLPPESATKAMVRASAPTGGGGGKARPAWVDHYGDEPTVSLLQDIWDLLSATSNTSKKKSPIYPRPKREKRPTRRSQPE